MWHDTTVLGLIVVFDSPDTSSAEIWTVEILAKVAAFSKLFETEFRTSHKAADIASSLLWFTHFENHIQVEAFLFGNGVFVHMVDRLFLVVGLGATHDTDIRFDFPVTLDHWETSRVVLEGIVWVLSAFLLVSIDAVDTEVLFASITSVMDGKLVQQMRTGI